MSLARHVVLVMSGKGGVGKSSVTVELALALLAKKFKVGILDVDLCGPSIPRMLHLENRTVEQSAEGWTPVYAGNLAVMSMGFLTPDRTAAVVWRGPKKTAVIGQFIRDVNWKQADLDYLIIDTPPGTSDEHISVVQELKQFALDGVVLVTTPQNIALGDVRREIAFCKKANLNIFGLFENMSGFVCPHCKECTRIFSSGGGQKLAELTKIPYLGAIPIDPAIGECLDGASGDGDIEALQKGLFELGSDGKCSLQMILDFVDEIAK